MKAGEFCAGYGGLMMAIEAVFNAEPAWVSEFDSAPSKILAHHYPTVPNLGDMTKVDWTTVTVVEVMGGGTPCQDLSHAGARRGMTEGTRSNLWVHMREAIATQRPLWVVWENVRGAYSAGADSEVEQCAGCMGEAGDGKHLLRALGRVLGDLSDLGYDVQWRGLRAADVGGVHARFRVFVLARRRGPATNTDMSGREEQWGSVTIQPEHAAAEHEGPDVADADCRNGGRGADSGNSGGGTTEVQDPPHADGVGLQRSRDSRGRWTRPTDGGVAPANTHDSTGDRERACPELGEGSEALANAISGGRDGWARAAGREKVGGTPAERSSEGTVDATDSQGDEGRELYGDNQPVAWGDYEPAIRRWERTIGRPAPRPTEPTGRNGGERLSPRFTEWMMGLPDGWVTDPAIGISRNDQLKACGNGVVPQQAVAALRDMLSAFQAQARAA